MYWACSGDNKLMSPAAAAAAALCSLSSGQSTPVLASPCTLDSVEGESPCAERKMSGRIARTNSILRNKQPSLHTYHEIKNIQALQNALHLWWFHGEYV